MAQPVYSTQLYAGYIGGGGTTTLYTVPSGKRAVVRTISAFLYSTPAGYVEFQLATVGSNLAVIKGTLVPDGDTWLGDHVLNAGQALTAVISNGAWRIHVSGFLFTE